ncbi:MAG TPA: hypothetical protein VEI25_04780 [Paraburkholderia sp.]|nr:hypothetical protein [Paraburkholderia sp.]
MSKVGSSRYGPKKTLQTLGAELHRGGWLACVVELDAQPPVAMANTTRTTAHGARGVKDRSFIRQAAMAAGIMS